MYVLLITCTHTVIAFNKTSISPPKPPPPSKPPNHQLLPQFLIRNALMAKRMIRYANTRFKRCTSPNHLITLSYALVEEMMLEFKGKHIQYMHMLMVMYYQLGKELVQNGRLYIRYRSSSMKNKAHDFKLLIHYIHWLLYC